MSVRDQRVAYILKMYPRLSETFILNEILAHERAGLDIDIFSLRVPGQPVEHADLRRVRAGVHYLPHDPIDARSMGESLLLAARTLGDADTRLCFEHSRGPWILDQAARIAAMAQERGVTHLHAHFATEATTVCRLASLMSGIPYSFTAHAKDIFHESVVLDDLRAKARDASAIVTVSEFNVRYLHETLGEDAARVVRIYNGLDLDLFPFHDGERETNHIVGVGRLVEKKGFCDLISACAILRDQGRRFRCTIIGDGDLYEDLSRQIEGLGLGSFVTLAGALAREDVRRIVARATVLCAPCVVGEDGNRDGLPTVLLEAMALGTPCVSTPVTGIPEVVRDGETGLMVDEHAPEQCAAALGRLLDDPTLARTLARNARGLIEREFDIHRNTAQMRALFASGPASLVGAS